jgi:hypothetical protein
MFDGRADKVQSHPITGFGTIGSWLKTIAQYRSEPTHGRTFATDDLYPCWAERRWQNNFCKFILANVRQLP